MSKRKQVDRFVSPAVVSGYCPEVDETGVVFKSLAGIDGMLVSGCMETDELPKDTKGVTIYVAVENRDGSGKSERLFTSKGKGQVKTEVPVSARSKITVSTDCIGAKGVWIAIAIKPNINNEFMQKVEDHEQGVPLQPRSKAVTRRH